MVVFRICPGIFRRIGEEERSLQGEIDVQVKNTSHKVQGISTSFLPCGMGYFRLLPFSRSLWLGSGGRICIQCYTCQLFHQLEWMRVSGRPRLLGIPLFPLFFSGKRLGCYRFEVECLKRFVCSQCAVVWSAEGSAPPLYTGTTVWMCLFMRAYLLPKISLWLLVGFFLGCGGWSRGCSFRHVTCFVCGQCRGSPITMPYGITKLHSPPCLQLPVLSSFE